MIKTQNQVLKILENDTNDSTENKKNKFEFYKNWVLSLNKEQLKGVIIGCAIFRIKNSNSRLFLATKKEKQKAKYNIKVANIYLDFAKDVFHCL